MTHCPRCNEWRYDPFAAALAAHRVGGMYPVVWDGERLRDAWGSETPSGYRVAVGAHICRDHSLDPDVLLLGPVMFGHELVRAAR